MTLEELSIREAVKDLKARYCFNIDMKRWDDYAGLFTTDAIMDVDQSVSTRGRPANPTPRITLLIGFGKQPRDIFCVEFGKNGCRSI